MSIYVKVGDDVVIVSGDRIEQGRHASSPIPIEVVEEQVGIHRRAGVLRAKIRGHAPPTVDQVAAVAGADPVARAAVRDAVEVVAPRPGGLAWRRATQAAEADPPLPPGWVQVLDGQVVAELRVDEVAGELNALAAAAGAPPKPWVGETRASVSGTVTLTQVAGKFVERAPRPTVDAVRWTGQNLGDVSVWVLGAGRLEVPRAESVRPHPEDPSVLVVWHDDGRLRVPSGSWLVESADGVVRVYDHGAFERIFAPAPIESGDLAELAGALGRGRLAADGFSAEPHIVESDFTVAERLHQEVDPRPAPVGEPRVARRSTVDTVRGGIEEYARYVEGNPHGGHAAVASDVAFRVAEQIDADYLKSSLETLRGTFMPELVEWRRWARGLLKEPEVANVGDDAMRRKIAAVLEAPAAISVDELSSSHAKYLVEIDLDALTHAVIGAYCADAGPDGALSFDRVRAVLSQRCRAPRAQPPGDPVVEACARVGHEVYRAGLDDPDMREWDLSPDYEREIALEGALAALSGATPEQWFESWRGKMAEDGWSYGPVKDEAAKRHPNLVARYADLPEMQRFLDQLFVVAVQATVRAIDELEQAYAVPVLRVSGNLPPEQFAAFKREWERTIGTNAWKTPIVDAPVAVVRCPPNPYTRSGMVSFVDGMVDSMLKAPAIWGSLREVELQVLLLLEVRAFVSSGQAGVDAVAREYHRFIAGKLGDTASAEPFAAQLDDLGRADELPGLLAEFAAARRAESTVVPTEDPIKGWLSARSYDHARMVELFEKHCECRPTNTARIHHSHDCNYSVTDDIRTAIHRVVIAGFHEEVSGTVDDPLLRAATDKEVRDARARLVASAIWDGVLADLKVDHP